MLGTIEEHVQWLIMLGIVAENKKIPNDITYPGYTMPMYCNEYEYEVRRHTLEDRTRGLRSRTSVVDEDDVVADLGVV